MERRNLFIFTFNSLMERILFILGLFVFKCILDLGYIYFVSPVFEYTGFFYNLNAWKVFESYILLFIFALILPYKIKRPSDFFVVFLFIFIAVPLLSIYGFKNEAREYLYMVLSSFVILYIVIHCPKIRFPKLLKGEFVAIILSICTLVALFFWITIRGGFNFLNFNLLRVYEFRREVAAVVFPGLLSYLSIWYAKVINIVLLVYYLWKRNYIAFAIIVICQVLFFGVTAHKSYLFYPGLVVIVYFFLQRKYIFQEFLFSLSALSLITLMMYWLFAESLPASLLVRRVFFVTADNHFAYYHFFTDSGFVYLSNSILSFLSKYPFEYPAPIMISLFLYGHSNTWVNTGFLATSYMHFGFVGMLIFSIFAGIIFKIIDGLIDDRLPLGVGVSIMIVPVFNLISADFLTTIFSHGLGLGILFLWLLGSRGIKPRLSCN